MIRISLIAATAAVLLTACGKSETEETPSGAPAPEGAPPQASAPAPAPLEPGQSLTAEGATASVGAAAAKIATPAYAPLYPGAVVATSVIGESGVGRGGMVTYRTTASPKAVIAFYEDKVTAAGKPVTMNQDMGDNVHMMTAGDSGDGRGAVQVIASPAGGGTEVQLTWSDDEPAASSSGPKVGMAMPKPPVRDNIAKKRTGG